VVSATSFAFWRLSHSPPMASNVSACAIRSACRLALGSISSATSLRASSRFSRARFKDTFGVRAQGKQLFYATKPIAEAPQPPTGGSDEHDQPALIEKLVRPVLRTASPNPGLIQHGHRGIRLPISDVPSLCSAVNGQPRGLEGRILREIPVFS